MRYSRGGVEIAGATSSSTGSSESIVQPLPQKINVIINTCQPHQLKLNEQKDAYASKEKYPISTEYFWMFDQEGKTTNISFSFQVGQKLPFALSVGESVPPRGHSGYDLKMLVSVKSNSDTFQPSDLEGDTLRLTAKDVRGHFSWNDSSLNSVAKNLGNDFLPADVMEVVKTSLGSQERKFIVKTKFIKARLLYLVEQFPFNLYSAPEQDKLLEANHIRSDRKYYIKDKINEEGKPVFCKLLFNGEEKIGEINPDVNGFFEIKITKGERVVGKSVAELREEFARQLGE